MNILLAPLRMLIRKKRHILTVLQHGKNRSQQITRPTGIIIEGHPAHYSSADTSGIGQWRSTIQEAVNRHWQDQTVAFNDSRGRRIEGRQLCLGWQHVWLVNHGCAFACRRACGEGGCLCSHSPSPPRWQSVGAVVSVTSGACGACW